MSREIRAVTAAADQPHLRNTSAQDHPPYTLSTAKRDACQSWAQALARRSRTVQRDGGNPMRVGAHALPQAHILYHIG